MSNGDASLFAEEALFLERLEVFLGKSMEDLRDFAHREGKDFEQIRLMAAEWHCKYLFDTTRAASRQSEGDVTAQTIINDILDTTSRTLESLQNVAGRHSLLLVVDPTTPDEVDDGFLGGTNTGREFWRDLRNGGAVGARHFKEFCRKSSGVPSCAVEGVNSHGSKPSPAQTMKNNLYAEMRSRLRAVSGIRMAEMKWTKPGKLSAYGVALEGWPRHIEYKNPSKMTFSESSTLMGLLLDNKLYFRPLRDDLAASTLQASVPDNSSTADDISWALNEDSQGSNPAAIVK